MQTMPLHQRVHRMQMQHLFQMMQPLPRPATAAKMTALLMSQPTGGSALGDRLGPQPIQDRV